MFDKESMISYEVQKDISENMMEEQAIKNIENHYCELTKFDDKIVIRCLSDDNYDLKKTLNFIMKNIINGKLPKSWDL